MSTYFELVEKGKDFYYKQNRAKEAQDCFFKALKHDKTLPHAYVQLANIARYSGNNDQALHYISIALGINENYSLAYLIQSRILLNIKKYQKA
jgi:Tfp pilus assembly protein PilF